MHNPLNILARQVLSISFYAIEQGMRNKLSPYVTQLYIFAYPPTPDVDVLFLAILFMHNNYCFAVSININ